MNNLRLLSLDIRKSSGIIKNNILKNPNSELNRLFKRTYLGETYEGTGKTTGHIVNIKGTSVFCINNIRTTGFDLTNGMMLHGSIIIFPDKFFSWKVQNVNDVNEGAFSLFTVLQPPVDCLFIGLGEQKNITIQKMKEILGLCRRLNIKFEICGTDSAAAMFNFCSLDRRNVAAALIPPNKISFHKELQLGAKSSSVPDTVVKESSPT